MPVSSKARACFIAQLAAAALEGIDNEQEIRELDRKLHDLRRGITQQMDEARSELAFSRFNQSAYQQFVSLGDQVRRRLTAMAEDRSLYVHARVEPGLVPSLPTLADRTAVAFANLASAIRSPRPSASTADLDDAIQALDKDLERLRVQRATAPFALDRMLPFWALVFNLKEVAENLKQLGLMVSELA